MTLCQHCSYAPARADCGGYCSWDCHDHSYVAPGDQLTGPAPALAHARAPTGRFGSQPVAAVGAA